MRVDAIESDLQQLADHSVGRRVLIPAAHRAVADLAAGLAVTGPALSRRAASAAVDPEQQLFVLAQRRPGTRIDLPPP